MDGLNCKPASSLDSRPFLVFREIFYPNVFDRDPNSFTNKKDSADRRDVNVLIKKLIFSGIIRNMIVR